MISIFYPTETAKSAFDIDYERLYREGVRGLIFDIDNTVAEHDAPAEERAVRLFERLRKIGFRCALVSNNKLERVKMFNREIGAHMVEKAGKPSKRGFLKAMKLMGTHPGNTVSIGDQIFTDIWGANRAGLRTILVGKLADHEEIQIVLKRIPEKLVLFFYNRGKRKRGRSHPGGRK